VSAPVTAVARFERAFRRVLPKDGSWHQVNVTPFVQAGTGRVRLVLSYGGRRAKVTLNTDEIAPVTAYLRRKLA
jgi:hypothetical protein